MRGTASYTLSWVSLDKRVPIVSISNKEGDDCGVFVGAVRGIDHYSEAMSVIRDGTEVPYQLAEVCFEDLALSPLKWYRPLHVFLDTKDYGPEEDWGDGKAVRD